VRDLEASILETNYAVSELLDFRPDELLEQWLFGFIKPERSRKLTAALLEVAECAVTRNARRLRSNFHWPANRSWHRRSDDEFAHPSSR
jgi:hypothetical protein